MSLRARLALVLGVVVLVPLLAAVVILGLVAPGMAERSGVADARRDVATASGALAARCAAVGDTAAIVAREAAAAAIANGKLDVHAAHVAAQREIQRRPGTMVAMLDPSGVARVAANIDLARATSVGKALRQASCGLGASGAAGAPAVVAETSAVTVPLESAGSWVPNRATAVESPDARTLATVVVWVPIDDAMIRTLRRDTAIGAQLAILGADQVGGPRNPVAVTQERETFSEVLGAIADGRGSGAVDSTRFAVRDAGPGVPYPVVAVNHARFTGLFRLAVAGALVAALIGALIARAVATRLTRPLAVLSASADRFRSRDGEPDVLPGRAEPELRHRGSSEIARLATAFDSMADRLDRASSELDTQRRALAESLDRFGEALSHTHDLTGLLRTVVATITRGTGAAMGAVYLETAQENPESGSVDPPRPVRRPALSVDPVAQFRIPESAVRAVGSGRAVESADESVPPELALLAIRAADTGRVINLDEVTGTATAADRVAVGPALALPIRTGDRVIGVVSVARGPGAPGFDPSAVDRARALTDRMGTAITNVRLHEEARRLSVTDPLTGVGNVRHLSTTLSREVERATRFSRPLSVLMLDLDNFKAVNDTLGHPFGDGVLREFAQRVITCVREVDAVSRYGGEEFALILPETDAEGAVRVAERVLEVVRAEPFRVGNVSRAVTVSIGVASFPSHGRGAPELLRAADAALYEAKRAGRDRWHLPGTSTEPASASRAG